MPICNVKQVESKLLSCGHSLCLKCIKDIVKPNYFLATIKCPFCRKVSEIPADGPDGLPTDFTKKQFEEILTAKLENICDGCKKDSVNLLCKNCKTQFCQKCADSHIKHKHFVIHHLVFLSDIQCKAHNKEVIYFCTSCVKLMCFMCVQDGQCNHDHQLIEIDKLEKQNAVEIERIKGVRHIIKQAITRQVTVKGIKELLDSLDKTERELVRHVKKLKIELETKERELKDQLIRRRNALQKLCEKVDGNELIDKESELTKLEETEKAFKTGHIKESLSAMSDIMSKVDLNTVTKDDQMVFLSQIYFQPINTMQVGKMKKKNTTNLFNYTLSISTGRLTLHAQINNTTGTAPHFDDSFGTVTTMESLFGNSARTATDSRSLFGTPASNSSENGSLFGGSDNTASKTGSLFGAPASTSTESGYLFDGLGNTAIRRGSRFGSPASTSTERGYMFGAPALVSATSENVSLFGASFDNTRAAFMFSPPSSASITTPFMFGASTYTTTRRSSIFGASMGKQLIFNAPASTLNATSMFGDTPTSATTFEGKIVLSTRISLCTSQCESPLH